MLSKCSVAVHRESTRPRRPPSDRARGLPGGASLAVSALRPRPLRVSLALSSSPSASRGSRFHVPPAPPQPPPEVLLPTALRQPAGQRRFAHRALPGPLAVVFATRCSHAEKYEFCRWMVLSRAALMGFQCPSAAPSVASRTTSPTSGKVSKLGSPLERTGVPTWKLLRDSENLEGYLKTGPAPRGYAEPFGIGYHHPHPRVCCPAPAGGPDSSSLRW